MQKSHSTTPELLFKLLAGVLVLKVTLSVVLGYRDYFPPNFESDFLRGRQSYFFGNYQIAFYAHILSGPISLLLGLALVSQQFRVRFPKWHRNLGKTQIALVLMLLTPSGLLMACYAESGIVAATGFLGLAIATGVCAMLGWRSAVQMRFDEHRRWMWRCFLLLCSAVIIRLIGGAVTVGEIEGNWTYPLAAWASWLVPLAAYEIRRVADAEAAYENDRSQIHSVPSRTELSSPAIEMSARR